MSDKLYKRMEIVPIIDNFSLKAYFYKIFMIDFSPQKCPTTSFILLEWVQSLSQYLNPHSIVGCCLFILQSLSPPSAVTCFLASLDRKLHQAQGPYCSECL